MGYDYRPRPRRRDPRKKFKKTPYKANTKINQNNISVLQKDLNKLKIKVGKTIHDYSYLRRLSDLGIAEPYSIHPLIAPNSWGPVFADDTNEAEFSKVVCTNISIDGFIDVGSTGIGMAAFTMYLVTLRPQAIKILDTNQALTTLVQDRHFTNVNGMAYLNLKLFEIKKRRRFQLGPSIDNNVTGIKVTNLHDTIRRFKITQKRNFKIEASTGTYQNWRQLSEGDIPIKNRLYLLIFYDNISTTNTYQLSYNAMYNVQM